MKKDYNDNSRRDNNRRDGYDRRERNDFERRENGGYRSDDRRSDGRRPYAGNRQQGPARRTYGENRADGRDGGRQDYGRSDNGRSDNGRSDNVRSDGRYRGNAPRVGRVYDDVPRAERVTGDKPVRPVDRRGFVERDFSDRPRRGGEFHRGGAYRSESGPRAWRDERPAQDYEPPEIPEDLAAEFADVDFSDEHMLIGRNPIREALKAGRPMEKLLVASGDLSGAAREIVRMAKDAGVIVQQVDRGRLDQIYPAHQGMLAYVAAVPYVGLEDILSAAKEKGEEPFILLLDGITDPHNLGAIIRSAECAGAHGVVVPERRAAGLGPAAAKAAAGALNHMPVARVKNLNRAIDELKAAGLWIIGTAMTGEDALTADLTGPIALVIGSEGDGIARLTLEKCDRTVSLPMKGHIESLNASVAAGILMYEVVRARAK